MCFFECEKKKDTKKKTGVTPVHTEERYIVIQWSILHEAITIIHVCIGFRVHEANTNKNERRKTR